MESVLTGPDHIYSGEANQGRSLDDHFLQGERRPKRTEPVERCNPSAVRKVEFVLHINKKVSGHHIIHIIHMVVKVKQVTLEPGPLEYGHE